MLFARLYLRVDILLTCGNGKHFKCSNISLREDAYSAELPLCLGVLEHTAPLARGVHILAKKKNFYDGSIAYVVQF